MTPKLPDIALTTVPGTYVKQKALAGGTMQLQRVAESITLYFVGMLFSRGRGLGRVPQRHDQRQPVVAGRKNYGRTFICALVQP